MTINRSQLAIAGGPAVRVKPFPAHVTIGNEELAAATAVMKSGILSRYLGCWHDDFYGGDTVRALEEAWAGHFGVKHAIAVNSCTSGLIAAVGAAGIEPGDEVIVSPYTMSASATAALIYGAIPVFADVEPDCFCLDVHSVAARITPRTRAIIVVDIFGQPYDVEGINALARKHGLVVIEDTAQAPGAKYRAAFAGTLGDVGVYSLNYHKHIHSGEGGIVATNDDALANRIQLIRNHAEAVIEGKGESDLVNMVGFNFRMTEIEAAIARCQLDKLDDLLTRRLANCRYIEKQLASIPALTAPMVRADCTHVYYQHAYRFDRQVAGVTRKAFVDALRAELPPFELRLGEGPKVSGGYVKPLYLNPMYQKRIAFGSKGYPFENPWNSHRVDYAKGICPVVENLHEETLLLHEFMVPSMTTGDMDDVVEAFHKVWDHRTVL